MVSTQVLAVKNDLYAEYSSEAAYQRAVATYGGENSNFLTPEANIEQPIAAPNPDEGGEEIDNPDVV